MLLNKHDIEGLRQAGIWTPKDKAGALETIEYLLEINERQGDLLGQALSEVERLRKRLEWYRKMTITEKT